MRAAESLPHAFFVESVATDREVCQSRNSILLILFILSQANSNDSF
jgi:hypothetical protein